MNAQSDQLLQALLALSEADRAEIAGRLIESLGPDAETDSDAEAAWDAEIRSRVESMDRGEATMIPWDDALARLRERKDG